MGTQHDHELNIDGTAYQFILIRDDNGAAMYNITEDIPNYQRSLMLEQTNWINGHGQFLFEDKGAYFEGQSIDTTKDGRIVLGAKITEVKESDDTDLDSAPVCFLWYENTSEWLCATSGKIYRYNVGANGKWTAATTTVAGVTHMVEYNGVAYAAVGSLTKYYYSTDGDTWTQTDLTDGYAVKFFVSTNAAGTNNVLWKSKLPNEVSSTTNGKTVAGGGVQWDSPAYIGDTSNDITNIFLINDELLIGKEDNLFHYDSSGGLHPYMDDLKVSRSTQNFKYITYWQAAAYFTKGTGLGEITNASTFDQMGALTGIDDIGKVGVYVGLASDPDWIYAAIDEGTNTHIYKGREVGTPNGLRWQWCPWVFLSTTTCATIAVCQHSTTDRRLWMGYGNSTAYVIITDDPMADSAARFASAGFLRMSYIYGTNPIWDKLFQSAVLETSNCASGITTQVKYRKDTDTTATECIAAHTTNGVHEVNFTSALACKRIQFEIHLATNDATKSPIVTFFQAKGTEKPTTIRVHEAYYRIGDKPSERAKTIRNLLRTARGSTTLVKFADFRFGQKTSGTSSGDYVWCVVMPGFPKEVEIIHEKQRQPELAIQVRLQEISYTIS
jgi:hypothetical protein